MRVKPLSGSWKRARYPAGYENVSVKSHNERKPQVKRKNVIRFFREAIVSIHPPTQPREKDFRRENRSVRILQLPAIIISHRIRL